MAAVEARLAGGGEGGDNEVTLFEVCDIGADLMDMAGQFMAHDESSAGWLMTSVDMELAAAQGGVFDLDNDVAGILDLRDGSVLERDVKGTIEDNCFHGGGGHVE